ncbi:MAG: ribonuclease PH, partial [Phycisphaeraceae bacterium]
YCTHEVANVPDGVEVRPAAEIMDIPLDIVAQTSASYLSNVFRYRMIRATGAIWIDCDVLQADGGTRTAAITGAYVALVQAIAAARADGRLDADPIVGPVAAVSVGIIDGKPHLDLDYVLDVRAEVDMNVAMDGKSNFIEVQGTGEKGVFSREELDALLDLASTGIQELMTIQIAALGG